MSAPPTRLSVVTLGARDLPKLRRFYARLGWRRSGYIADPEGNRWEIAWAPGAAFDERGALTSFG